MNRAGDFEWDKCNEEHVRRHGVEPEEVEEAPTDPERKPLAAYNKGGERRRGVIGATEAGRILFVIYAVREGRVRPITANDATRTQKRRYRR
jgi:uncharacterized DUF497 family protein